LGGELVAPRISTLPSDSSRRRSGNGKKRKRKSFTGRHRGGLATRAGISGTVGIASRQTTRVSTRDVDRTSAAGKKPFPSRRAPMRDRVLSRLPQGVVRAAQPVASATLRGRLAGGSIPPSSSRGLLK
jgi:hypothetical protein